MLAGVVPEFLELIDRDLANGQIEICGQRDRRVGNLLRNFGIRLREFLRNPVP